MVQEQIEICLDRFGVELHFQKRPYKFCLIRLYATILLGYQAKQLH